MGTQIIIILPRVSQVTHDHLDEMLSTDISQLQFQSMRR